LIPASRSIVIVANAHNPTILHPAFLRAQHIVGDQFISVDESLICTGALSYVAFSNGINITVEASRLVVRDTLPEGASPNERPSISEIGQNYIRVLPHVPYTSVGVNFTWVVHQSNPGAIVRDKYIAQGPWTKDLVSAEIGLRYSVRGGQLNIRVAPGQKRGDEKIAETAILTRFNYSFPLDPASLIDNAMSVLSDFANLEKDSRQKCIKLLGMAG
jgi:hypothetical protein